MLRLDVECALHGGGILQMYFVFSQFLRKGCWAKGTCSGSEVCVRACAHVCVTVLLCVHCHAVESLHPTPFSMLTVGVPCLCRKGVGAESSNWRDPSEPAPAPRPQAISPSHPTTHEKCVEYLSKGKKRIIA